MNQKTNCVGPQKEGQVKRIEKAGSGRRKFLTIVAGAGAAVALLGSQSARAQEKKPFSASNPWTTEGGKKMISKEQVEGLIQNARKGKKGLNPFKVGGPESTKHFRYEVSEDKNGFSVELYFKKSAWKETVAFNASEANGAAYVFKPKGHAAIEDELLVFAAGGKMAVCFLDKTIGAPVLMQFSLGSGEIPKLKQPVAGSKPPKIESAWGMPNPGKNSSEPTNKTGSAKIGYECKDGKITLLSAQGKMENGGTVPMVEVTADGTVLSMAREIGELEVTEINMYR